MRSRVLVLLAVAPEAARALCPDGTEPRLWSERSMLLMTYTRLGSLEGPLLPHRRASTHHLAYRIPVVRGGRPETWVARRETSSRLGARWNEKILRREHGRSSFELERDAFRLKLSVSSPRREELFLHVELAECTGKRFASAEDVQHFLDEGGDVRPSDVLAPEADQIEARNAFAPEALAVFELRSAFLDEHFGDDVEIDGAWRLAPRRTAPVRDRATPRSALSVNELPAV